MKRLLSVAFAFAVAGTMLSGCGERADNNRPAGAGGTTSTAPSGSPSGSASGSASGTVNPDQPKRNPSSPATPGGAGGSGSGSASGGTGSK